MYNLRDCLGWRTKVNVFKTYSTSPMFAAIFISISPLPISSFHKNLKSIVF